MNMASDKRSPARIVAGGLLLVLGTAFVWFWSQPPSLDREWDEDVRVLTPVEQKAGGSVRLAAVRDWSYTQNEIVSKSYTPVEYDVGELEGLWLYEQDIGLDGLIAHTFLVFQFSEEYGDTRWLGLSVETRREVGEQYSIVRGLLHGFELTHIWATERDLVRRRVEYLDYPLTRYHIDVPVEYVRLLFQQMTAETHALSTDPRWYNTVRTNCTSSLIAYVNQAEPGAIPCHYWDTSTSNRRSPSPGSGSTRTHFADAVSTPRVDAQPTGSDQEPDTHGGDPVEVALLHAGDVGERDLSQGRIGSGQDHSVSQENRGDVADPSRINGQSHIRCGFRPERDRLPSIAAGCGEQGKKKTRGQSSATTGEAGH
jgi:hypothetical protein